MSEVPKITIPPALILPQRTKTTDSCLGIIHISCLEIVIDVQSYGLFLIYRRLCAYFFRCGMGIP